MQTIIFVTGNKYKFEVAQKALEGLNITLVQKKLAVPEIQSTKVEEVASFSAQWASEVLKKPVVLTDSGYYIEALNGFPGPFVKYANKWLTSSDFLNLMKEKKNRTVLCKECLAFCEPGKKPTIFLGIAKGKIAKKKGPRGKTSIDEIFIPEGFEKTISEIPWEKMIGFWDKSLKIWQKFGELLKH